MVAHLVSVGERYGRLTVVAYAGSANWKRRYECLCDCGRKKVIRGEVLRRGESRSCGCLSVEMVNDRNRTHGKTGTPTWQSWNSMKRRCSDPGRWNYKFYGGRGIAFCDRWASFENFLADMGERPDGTSLDRVNNDGNYEPSNCRWATRSQQRMNRRDMVRS